MTYLEELIGKHRVHGVLIDTNLMILWLVGRADRRKIAGFKRTQVYTINDYELLEQFISAFQRIVTTPHVLTEISNLTSERFAAVLKWWVGQAHELCDLGKTIVEDSCFLKFGLTDAAISMAGKQDFLVLTDDLRLCDVLQRQGCDAINFSHLRGWV